MTDCKPPHWNYIFITSHLGDMILNYAKAYALLKVRIYVATFLSPRQVMAWYATFVTWSLKTDNTIHAHEKGWKNLDTCNVDKLHISLQEEASLLPSWWGGRDDDIIIMESPLGFSTWRGGRFPSSMGCPSPWWEACFPLRWDTLHFDGESPWGKNSKFIASLNHFYLIELLKLNKAM